MIGSDVSTLLLVRHGQSEWNRIGKLQGHFDSPLTEKGIQQAEAVANRLVELYRGHSFRIYSSPLSRAHDTAAIIADALSLKHAEIRDDVRLIDYNLGEISGTYGWRFLAEEDPERERVRVEDPFRFHPRGGESGAECDARLRDFLAHLPEDDVLNLIVTHGVINKYIRSIRRNLTSNQIIPLNERQDTIYRLDGAHEREITVPTSPILAETKQVSVQLASRSYDIVVGCGLLTSATEYLKPIVNGRRVALVSDDRVLAQYLEAFAPQLDDITSRWDIYQISGGEGAKSFHGVEQLLNQMLGDGVDRHSIMIAFGGGVVGDVAGLAAALLMRGIELIQVPTTLMAQIDSSVGGKNGINTRHGKNLVGSFWQPRIVLNDVSTLLSLPPAEFRAGYGEIIKYGLLVGDAEFSWLEEYVESIMARHELTLIEVIRMGCQIKADIVSEDEFDQGKRAFVNLGHTFAHAFEAQAGFGRFPHGNAVAVGLIAACQLSQRVGVCAPDLTERVQKHVRAAGLPTNLQELCAATRWQGASLYNYMLHDKKTINGKIHFVLLKGIGKPFSSADVEPATVYETLSFLGAA